LKRGFNQGGLDYWRELRTEEEDDWQPGPTYRRGEEGFRGTGSGEAGMGHGLFLLLGRRVPRGPFYIFFFFLFFFFYFLVSFITFANLVQIASNQLCKVSKIQNNNPEQ
jgi:hypothetical protein